MSFNIIPGQHKTKKILQDSIKNQRINHAYLFTGNNGLGKLEMAREFTRAVLCNKNGVDACGECLSCKKIEHHNHPDFKITEVLKDHKRILIDQIREMQKEISYKPYESEYKIYIINQAAKMTVQAQNSLLKTLEEPPKYAIIILINESKNELIPTIVSRCQEVKLYNQSKDVIKDYLKKHYNLSPKKSLLYATIARGKYKKAVNLSSKNDFIDNREVIIKFITNIDKKDNFAIYNFSEKLVELSDTDFPLFELMLSLLRDILVMKRDVKDNIINFDYKELISNTVDKFDIYKIYELTGMVNKYNDYSDKNIKKELLFPSLLFKIRNSNNIG
ncbi:MAG: DNA polymerase III subunit delta' [Halanaerobiales bacterium]|nr:DNA polymerase III subunit delta' [Halanaerobiales bacterium]